MNNAFVFAGTKKAEYYKGLLVRADLGLHEQVALQLKKHYPSGCSVLDLGAGQGALSARLADMGFDVTAADIAPEDFGAPHSIKFERINFDNAGEFAEFVSRHMEAFEAVCGIEVIEHLEDQWQYVRNLVRMLRPGGLLILTTPNTTSWLSRIQFLVSGRFHQFGDADVVYGHIAPISPFELKTILERQGLRDIGLLPAGTLAPLYFSGWRMALLSLCALPLRPFQKNLIDGW